MTDLTNYDEPRHPKKKKAGRPKGARNLAMGKYIRFTPAVKRAFLKKLAEGYSISAACGHIGVSRTAYYYQINNDEKFKEAVEAAQARGVEKYEQEVENRIFKGTETVEYDADGKITKKTVKKSDALLLAALKANDPERWSDKSQKTNININHDSGTNTGLMKLADALGVKLDEKDITPDKDAIDGEWKEK